LPGSTPWLSWQIIPERLYDLVSNPDPARATAATRATYSMRKIVFADLESAAASV
jgi:predicted 3-demethylubiquinone-9 3-methyltransferase (glyoxalase superfamily)